MERVDVEFGDFAPLLKITTPGKSLAEYYAELTAAPV